MRSSEMTVLHSSQPLDVSVTLRLSTLAVGCILYDGVEAGQRVGLDRSFPPLDDVSFVIVVCRLDYLDMEGTRHAAAPTMDFMLP